MTMRTTDKYKMWNLLPTLLFCTLVCHSAQSMGIITQPNVENYSDRIVDLSVEILEACYSADFRTIVVHVDSDANVIKSLTASQSMTMLLLNDSSKLRISVEQQKKMNLFLSTANSSDQLHDRLLIFKMSSWWNIMAPLFIPDGTSNDCSKARNILRTAWMMNFPTSFYLCRDSQGRPMIYTYNPYTNRAPSTWKRIENSETIEQSDGWTMYRRSYQKENICDGLRFVRTKYIDGSVVRLLLARPGAGTPPILMKYNEELQDTMYARDYHVLGAMKIALNATVSAKFLDYQYSDRNQVEDFGQLLHHSTFDLTFCLTTIWNTQNLPITHPFSYGAVTVLTQRLGYYTPWEKICNYYGLVTLVSMLILLSITFIVVLKTDERERLAFAGFEVLRLVVNTALHSSMRRVAVRVFFSVIFLYFLIIHATFQGNISSFLTKEQERRNVEAVKDLYDSRYKRIYVPGRGKFIYDDPILAKKAVSFRGTQCYSEVVKNERVACITDDYYGKFFAIQYDLHYMKQSVAKYIGVLMTRFDWPLKNRFDHFLMKLESSGLAKRWGYDVLDDYIARQKGIAERSVVLHRAISLSALTFALTIWIVGITCASLCFIFEVRNGGKKSDRRRRRRVVHWRYLP